MSFLNLNNIIGPEEVDNTCYMTIYLDERDPSLEEVLSMVMSDRVLNVLKYAPQVSKTRLHFVGSNFYGFDMGAGAGINKTSKENALNALGQYIHNISLDSENIPKSEGSRLSDDIVDSDKALALYNEAKSHKNKNNKNNKQNKNNSQNNTQNNFPAQIGSKQGIEAITAQNTVESELGNTVSNILNGRQMNMEEVAMQTAELQGEFNKVNPNAANNVLNKLGGAHVANPENTRVIGNIMDSVAFNANEFANIAPSSSKKKKGKK